MHTSICAIHTQRVRETKKYILFYFILIFIVIQLELYVFSPHPSTPPQPNPPPSPTSILPFYFFYRCSIIVVPISPHYSPLLYPPPLLLHSVLTIPLLSLSRGPWYMFPDLIIPLLSAVSPLIPPLWLLSVCSLFPCLWFYFAQLVLLIRIHL